MENSVEFPDIPSNHTLVSGTVQTTDRRTFGKNSFFSSMIQAEDGSEFYIASDTPLIWPGQAVVISGETSTNTSQGKNLFQGKSYTNLKQYTIHDIRQPLHSNGVIGYLTSFPSVGSKTAQRIAAIASVSDIDGYVDDYKNDPKSTNPVRSIIGQKKFETFAKAWSERNITTSPHAIYLRSLGLSLQQTKTIIEHYGEKTQEKIQENPYRLMEKIRGYGFLKCDEIALKMGIPHDSPLRVNAAISNAMTQSSQQKGHCYLTLKELKSEVARLSRITGTAVDNVMSDPEMQTFMSLDTDDGIIYTTTALYNAEIGVLKTIKNRSKTQAPPLKISVDILLKKASEKIGKTLNKGQEAAFRDTLSSSIQIITGGPGTGKTMTLGAITTALKICGWTDENILLLSSSGRAAVNMSTSTKIPAFTIQHAIVDANVADKKGKPSKISLAKIVVIDETSMLNTTDMNRIFSLIPQSCRILMLGDPNQLLPIGPGNPFQTLIKSGYINVARLTEVRRQDQDSAIIKAAQAISRGEMPELTTDPNSDFIFIRTAENTEILKKIVDTAVHRLPARFNFHPNKDIQIIAPQRPGPIGNEIISAHVRDALITTGYLTAPEKEPEGNILEKDYLIGEKIMQTANNWDLDIANGEIGFISEIEIDKLSVSYPRSKIEYDQDTIGDTTTAYSVSVHKMQGSESPVIIFPISSSHSYMLNRRLVFTALTRARKKTIFIGQPAALERAIRNIKDNHKNSLLDKLIDNPNFIKSMGESLSNNAKNQIHA